MDEIREKILLKEPIKYLSNISQNRKSLYLFLFMIFVIYLHYISYYINTNYLLTLIVLCLLLIIFFINHSFNESQSYRNNKDIDIEKSDNDKGLTYLVNNVQVYNLYSKLSILETIDKERVNLSKKNMNDFYYLLEKSPYNYNNIGSTLKMKRDEAKNILKSIDLLPISKKYESKINREYKKYIIYLNINLLVFIKERLNNTSRIVTTVEDINAPDENNLDSMDFCKHYSIY